MCKLTMSKINNVCKFLEANGYNLLQVEMKWIGGGIWEFWSNGKLIASYDENSRWKNLVLLG